MTDPRREPSDPEATGESGLRRVHELVAPLAPPDGHEDDPIVRLILEDAARRDMLFGFMFEEHAEARKRDAKRLEGEDERREHYDTERRQAEATMRTISSEQSEIVKRMGEVSAALLILQRKMEKLDGTVDIVQRQGVQHGKRIAELSQRIENLTAEVSSERSVLGSRIAHLEEEFETIRAELEALKKAFWEDVRARHRKEAHEATGQDTDPAGASSGETDPGAPGPD